MNLVYEGKHSVTFGEKNSWTDWNLMPTTRPVINDPTPYNNFVDIVGANGSLDLSETLSDHPVYGDRTGSIEFLVEPGVRPWQEVFTEISGYLHNVNRKLILSDDPTYYYYGRFNIVSWRSDKNCSYITIGYELEPFKKLVNLPSNQQNLSVSGSRVVTLNGTEAYESPIFTVRLSSEYDMGVLHKGKYYNLPQGSTQIPEIQIAPGVQTLTLYGNGTVTVDYRGGRL